MAKPNCLDLSNYTDELTLQKVNEWVDAGIERLIIQAFPSDYHQYAEQLRQISLAQQAGLTWDAYIYHYLAYPQWHQEALAALPGGANMVWLDEEDVESDGGLNQRARVTAIQRGVNDVLRAGYRVGIYTAQWWWVPKTGNSTEFASLPLWDADYDGIADTELSWEPYGGWTSRAIKQYAGTSTYLGVGGLDLNVLSIEEGRDQEPPQEEPVRETPEDYPHDTWRESAIAYRGALDSVVPELNRLREIATQIAEILGRLKDS